MISQKKNLILMTALIFLNRIKRKNHLLWEGLWLIKIHHLALQVLDHRKEIRKKMQEIKNKSKINLKMLKMMHLKNQNQAVNHQILILASPINQKARIKRKARNLRAHLLHHPLLLALALIRRKIKSLPSVRKPPVAARRKGGPPRRRVKDLAVILRLVPLRQAVMV